MKKFSVMAQLKPTLLKDKHKIQKSFQKIPKKLVNKERLHTRSSIKKKFLNNAIYKNFLGQIKIIKMMYMEIMKQIKVTKVTIH